jgi:hypothetical protein
MKKPMKFKRYEGGGEISGAVDPKEAADKEAGLKASKGDDIGFLQRLRMGNIDDPSSEAYKRFGAGRGRSERNPVNESVSVSGSEPIVRPSMRPNPIFAAGEEQGKRQPSGDASVAEDYANRPRNPEAIQEADNPRKTAKKPTAPKPNASKPSKAAPKLIDPSNIRNERLEFEESQIAPKLIDPSNIRSGRQEFEESQIAPVDVTKLSLAERQKLKNQRSKSTDVTKLSLAESMKMKSGGSVSSASRRADGIATKGKTRGRMC